MEEQQSMHYYLPVWQTSPLLKTNHVNQNMIRSEEWSTALEHVLRWKSAFLGGMQLAPPGDASHSDPDTALFASLESIKMVKEGKSAPNVLSTFL